MKKRTTLNRYGTWALITGASSGIGKAFAIELAKQGINSLLISNERDELEHTAAFIETEYNVSARPLYADLSDTNFLDGIRDEIDSVPVTIVINNASFAITGEFEKRSIEEYRGLINVNINAYLTLTHYMLPKLKAADAGALIFVSSLNAFAPIAECATYTASKAFELSFGSALWYEVRDTNIDTLVVTPGATKTNFQKRAGTKVSAMAMEPEEVVAEAFAKLGKSVYCLPGKKNRMIKRISDCLTYKKRIKTASEVYIKMLHTNPEIKLGKLIRTTVLKRKVER